jgi:hypothetical protein
VDVADLGGDRERQLPADPRHREQQPGVWVIGAARAQAAVDLVDLPVEVVDHRQTRVDGSAPRLRDSETVEQLAAGDPEQIANRARMPEREQRRMNAVLEHRAMLDQMQPEAGLLALGAHPRVGQPDRRHQITMREHRQDLPVDPIGLARQRRQALDLLSVGTSHPSSSSVSRTNRAPVIDSITPRTRPCGPTRSTSRRSPSASGGAASCATTSPASPIRHTSTRLRLRSDPTCNMSTGLLDLALR